MKAIPRMTVSLFLVAVLALSALPVATAATPTPGAKANKPTPPVAGDKRHAYFGIVQSLGSDSFVLQTKKGEEVTVLVAAATRIHIPGLKTASQTDIMAGDRVAVNGKMAADGFTAKNIAVAPGKPLTRHGVGEVSAYADGTSITVTDKKGAATEYKLTADTLIKGPGGVTEVKIGDLVTVVARRVPAVDYYTATAIVVHPDK